jgi:exosome complex component RRP40
MASSSSPLIDTLVLPGDVIFASAAEAASSSKKPIRIGQGLTQQEQAIIAQKTGYLRYIPIANKYFIESNQRTYNQLATDDMIIGVIKERAGENYRVDINSPYSAVLNLIAFDGATKRNRPDLKPGSLVYARVLTVNRDMDPELTCMASNASQRKDWVTGLSLFGELKDGHLIQIDSAVCRLLLQPNNELLKQLGDRIAYEVAIGLNGRVWVYALTDNHVKDTILLANAILNYQYLTSPQQIKQMLDKLFSSNNTPIKNKK